MLSDSSKAHRLDPAAREAGAEILDEYALELVREARRIADRLDSTTVSKDYVRQAAFNLRLARRRGIFAESLTSLGISLSSAAAGVVATLRTASVTPEAWVDTAALVVLLLGAIAAAVGLTLSFASRRR